MTFENNIMESKKIIAKGMLLSVGVGMMMSHDRVYGASGSSTPPAAKKIEDVLSTSQIDEVFGKNQDFVKLIGYLKTNKDFDVNDETGFCCCKHKLDIMKVKIKNKSKNKSCDGVYALVYECLAVDAKDDKVVYKKPADDALSALTKVSDVVSTAANLQAINDKIDADKKPVK